MPATFDLWLDDVKPDIPGASNDLILYWIKRSALDFIRKSRMFKKTSQPFDVVGYPGDILLPGTELPPDQMIYSIHRVWHFGKELEGMRPDDIHAYYGHDWQTAYGQPRFFTQQTEDTLRLVPEPTDPEIESLVVSFSYGPNEAAIDVPLEVFNRWRTPIAAGAKANLMMMQKKPWSAPELAAVWAQAFNAGLANASLRSVRGTASAPLVTTPHPF